MQKIGRWIGGEKPETRPQVRSQVQPQVQEALRQIEAAPPNSGLGKKVAHDARQIMTKLERYCEELKADEARVAEALEQIRADLEEAREVIRAMRPAIDVVNKMCSRVSGDHELHETVEAVRVLKNKTK